MVKGVLAITPFILSIDMSFEPITKGNIAKTTNTGTIIIESTGFCRSRFMKTSEITEPTRNQPKKFCHGIPKNIPGFSHFQAPLETANGSSKKSNETRIRAAVKTLVISCMPSGESMTMARKKERYFNSIQKAVTSSGYAPPNTILLGKNLFERSYR